MRIAYLVHFRGGRDTGIYRKVREHVAEWSRLGFEVGLFVATDDDGMQDWADIIETKRVERLPRRPTFSLLARERLASAVRRWHPDVVYVRHGLTYPGLVLIARSFPTVIEVNADDIPEFRLTSTWRYAFSRVSRSIVLNAAAGFVFVTRELATAPSFVSFKKPWIAIGNGIDLRAFPQLPAPHNEHPSLLFVGHPSSPWHGLDHAAEIATAFPSWRIDVVGPSPGELRTAPPNMLFHGRLDLEAYLPLAGRADIAIGTLGLYRKGLQEASPLKVREYLALGLPTIIAYKDTDFPDTADFLLRLPNEPQGVAKSLSVIAEFVARWRGSRVSRPAVAGLDLSVKEVTRTAFLQKVAKESQVS